MTPPPAISRFCWPVVALVLAGSTARAAGPDAIFKERVLPLLEKHCHECHSHAAKKSKNGLVLDSAAAILTGGDSGPAVVAGEPEKSLLISAVRHASPDLHMPPKGKAKLSEAEVALLVEWVRQVEPLKEATVRVGTDWWSLKPLVRPVVPSNQYSVFSVRSGKSAPKAPTAKLNTEHWSLNTSANPIDAFVAAKLREHKLPPSPEADARTLIRRLHFDLIGLPPSPEEVEGFEREVSLSRSPTFPPAPMAGEKVGKWESGNRALGALVDKLLSSPHHGERWARHWLDTIHFADTHGFEHDVFRTNAWRYRDYVITAFNRDVPWQRFIREQLAADVFYPAEPQLTAALGFLGAGPLDTSTQSTAPRTFEYLDRDDLVTQTMSAFASTTAHCARCHAHKFDPISQEDYYALQAVFAGITKADVPFDESPATGQQRQRWQSLLAAADAKNAPALLTPENEPAIARWEQTQGKAVTEWLPLALESFLSSDGATLTRETDGSVSAGGKRPEKDTYTVTTATTLASVTALRLEVLSDERLPKKGPGRMDNGNLHLSEFDVRLLMAGSTNATKLKLKRATADFDQAGWPVASALDGNEKTAWGIYPRVGESHLAVFEFESPVKLAAAGSKLVVALRQLHGGGHLIGRFHLSATDSPNANAEAVPPLVSAGLKVSREQRTTEQRLAIAAHALRLHAQAELARLPAPASVFAVTRAAEPKAVHVLKRGDIGKPGHLAEPGALSALAELPARFALAEPKREAMRRVALADWLADPRNPLTWRSAANRVWHFHFGRGLCDTPSDFGRMGGVPSHPELLDWLACELRDSGSLKHLHRLIVTSAAYRQRSQSSVFSLQSSVGNGRSKPTENWILNTDHSSKTDPDNRLLWRMNSSRLDAESFRDAVLAVSGRMDLALGGPGTQHFKLSKGPQLTPKVDYTPFDWDAPGAGRRSIYRVVWRGIADPFMEALDFPDAALLQPTRSFSASALQALTLFNNDFVLRHSEHFAARVQKLGEDTPARVRAMVRLAFQRAATPEEVRAMSAYAEQHGLPALGRVLFNSNEFLFIN
ncbi:MAG: PSD1 and planctomycete cytochrome C domain-containing protein [Limisphaerales bacterium]